MAGLMTLLDQRPILLTVRSGLAAYPPLPFPGRELLAGRALQSPARANVRVVGSSSTGESPLLVSPICK